MPLLSVVVFTSNGQVDTADPVICSKEDGGLFPSDASTYIVPTDCIPSGGDIFSNKF